jgi:cysteine desulfurase/selenocysteine lyase
MSAVRPVAPTVTSLDVAAIRRDFPILDQQINGKPLVYLDNAASSQRPRAVIDAISRYYERDHANVHRGVHTLSQRATDAFEGSREIVRGFLNARETKEIIFTRGTTEAINLVAQSFARPRLEPGDEILISGLEHHANIVSWQLACQQTGATLKVIPIDETGTVQFNKFERLIGPRTKLLALAHVSNALGTIVPVEKFIARAKELGVR